MARKLSIPAIALLVTLAAVPSCVAASPHRQQRISSASSVARASGRPALGGSLIAPATVCPNQKSLADPIGTQTQAMRCMTNFARVRSGMAELSDSPQLDLSAGDKSEDILSCDSFSHTACGREFTYWIQQAGYLSTPCWRAGEDLAWGRGEYGTVRAIFRAWMASPEHRHNILGDYSEFGISLMTGGLEGATGTHVWTEHFGSHCNTAPSQQ